MARHLFARMGITITHHMRARPMAITARIGLRAECSSEPDPGSTAFTGVGAIGAVEDSTDAAASDAVLRVADAGSKAAADL